MSCLSLCSLGNAWNIPVLGLVGNGLETCCLLAIVMLLKRLKNIYVEIIKIIYIYI